VHLGIAFIDEQFVVCDDIGEQLAERAIDRHRLLVRGAFFDEHRETRLIEGAAGIGELHLDFVIAFRERLEPLEIEQGS